MIVEDRTAPTGAPETEVAPKAGPTRLPATTRHRRAAAMVDRARTGDAAAFDHLVVQNVDDVHGFLCHRTGSLASAEEITWELFVSQLRSMNEFRWTGVEFGPWLVRRARLLTERRRDGDLAPAGRLAPLADLGAAQRDCLLLRFVLGWSLAETAQATGRGVWTARRLQLSALKTLDGLDAPGRRRVREVIRREATAARRAEGFDVLLTVPRQRGRGADGPYEPLLDLVAELRSVPAVEPRPAFVEALREELSALAEEALADVPAPPAEADVRPRPEALSPGRTGPSRPALACLAVATVTAPVLAWAVASSAPGDLLHPGKEMVESMQVAGADDDAEKGSLLLEHAEHRLDEVRSLAGDGDLSAASSTLAVFSHQAAEGERLLRASGTDADHQALRWFAHDAVEQLRALEQEPGLGEQAREAADRITDLDVRAATACATCTAQE